jgi:hypothetical protein
VQRGDLRPCSLYSQRRPTGQIPLKPSQLVLRFITKEDHEKVAAGLAAVYCRCCS